MSVLKLARLFHFDDLVRRCCITGPELAGYSGLSRLNG